jgi:hypothetical protein
LVFPSSRIASRFAAFKTGLSTGQVPAKYGKISGKPGKKREMRRDYDRFFARIRMSFNLYQGSRRPRIVRWSGMPVCGDWQFVINF